MNRSPSAFVQQQMIEQDMRKHPMTVDEANTALAIAGTRQQRHAAYKALSVAATQAADDLNDDESEGYKLQTRLIEARRLLEFAADRLAVIGGQDQRALDEIDQAMIQISIAIEAL